jgi:hypothetical protein
LEKREEGRAMFAGASKWKPPLDLFIDVSKQFPTLAFVAEWEEPGERKYGCATIANGECIVIDLKDVVNHAQDCIREQLEHRFGDHSDVEYEKHAVHVEMKLGRGIVEDVSQQCFGDQCARRDDLEDAARTAASESAIQLIQELFKGSYGIDVSLEAESTAFRKACDIRQGNAAIAAVEHDQDDEEVDGKYDVFCFTETIEFAHVVTASNDEAAFRVAKAFIEHKIRSGACPPGQYTFMVTPLRTMRKMRMLAKTDLVQFADIERESRTFKADLPGNATPVKWQGEGF